jgi:lipopolysaccharide transport system ATP-binding protein
LHNLGAGFHPDLTGRENATINGVVGGLTRQELSARLESIIDFSELEAFIDSPLRVYSSGMQMRLAFSIAIHAQPDVLLIDEVLAVGDLAFSAKVHRADRAPQNEWLHDHHRESQSRGHPGAL